MCAILGVSFAPGSTIDRQALAAALLDEGDVRGRDASGWAWARGDEDGMFKANVPGANISVEDIPQDAEAIIAHTRAATTGSPTVNDNNHPVLSPSGNIRLVHNGVIYNHLELRGVLDNGAQLAEVDTSVIPGVLEELGLENTDLIAGDASAAWFDRETGSMIHLARFSHSPVNVAFLEDGSFAFASTESILGRALNTAGINWWGTYPGPFGTLANKQYVQLKDGAVIHNQEVEWNDGYYSRYAYDLRKVTSGATTQQGAGSGFGNVTYSTDPIEAPANPNEDDPDYSEYDDAYSTPSSDLPMALSHRADGVVSVFYTRSHSGDYVEYQSMTTLLAALRWYSQLNDGVDLVSDDSGFMKWVNHFEDIGELVEGSDDSVEEESWVANPPYMEDWGSALPPFVRDGVDTLRKVLVG